MHCLPSGFGIFVNTAYCRSRGININKSPIIEQKTVLLISRSPLLRGKYNLASGMTALYSTGTFFVLLCFFHNPLLTYKTKASNKYWEG